MPGRRWFDGHEGHAIPSVASEIALLSFYGARTLAVTLNGEGLDAAALAKEQRELEHALGIPVVRPLEDGLGRLVPLVCALLAPADA